MLRHSYDNCLINHTISQVENLQKTCDRSLMTILGQISRYLVNPAPGSLFYNLPVYITVLHGSLSSSVCSFFLSYSNVESLLLLLLLLLLLFYTPDSKDSCG